MILKRLNRGIRTGKIPPSQTTGWFLVGNEGMSTPYNPLKDIYRALIPSFPAKNQGDHSASAQAAAAGIILHVSQVLVKLLADCSSHVGFRLKGLGFRALGLGFRV